eukprot:UN03105
MVNYQLGVRLGDNFRFRVVDERKTSEGFNLRKFNSTYSKTTASQTSNVTAYRIPYRSGMREKCELVIIDTPDFGDTRGPQRVEIISKLLKEDSLVKSVDCVCFVVKANVTRLNASVGYVFHKCLSLFGEDFKNST